MATAAELERFFGSLNAETEHVAESGRRRLARFFDELAPRLKAARTLERELDRQLARRFNAFDYLRSDELGLSGVIADLLNPVHPHGQGDTFLRLLRDRVGFQFGGDPGSCRVDVERTIDDRLRLDIAARFDHDRSCLVIENKPYAGDQENQIRDYLTWLRKNYDNFLLIYLSPHGEPPSGYSVQRADLQDYADHFRIMPYHRAADDPEDDGFERFRTDFGLTDWLRECRMRCDVERLRWFLREAETFCERQFGGNAMTTSTLETIKEFVLADGRNWKTALEIEAALPKIHAEVRRQFLEAIADRLTGEGYRSGSESGDGPYCSWVRAYLPGWRKYQNHTRPEWSRMHLALEAGERRGNYWYVGIRAPLQKSRMSADDRSRLTRIEQRLADDGLKTTPRNDWWPAFELVEERYRDWDPLIPDMQRELQENGGEIIDYFVGELVKIARIAKPILDDDV